LTILVFSVLLGMGVLLGSLLGARLLMRANVRPLRFVFSLVIVALAVEMIYHGLTGRV
jgi:hypothetical protein